MRSFGDPALRIPAIPVEFFDASLQKEVREIKRILKKSGGVGLAATQVGVMHRLFLICPEHEGRVHTIVNPQVEKISKNTEVGMESCLSIPGVSVTVERACSLTLCAQDVQGRPLRFEAEGWVARIIQHEIDHLNGVLILDRCLREERRKFLLSMVEGSQLFADLSVFGCSSAPLFRV